MTKTTSWIASIAALLILVSLGAGAQQTNGGAKKAPRLTNDDLRETQPSLAGPTENETSSVRPITAADAPSDALLRAARAVRAVRSYRVRYESDANSGIGDHTTVAFEFVASDQVHLLMASGPPGRKPETGETLLVGTSAYEKLNGGRWAKIPEPNAPKAATLQSHFLPSMVAVAMVTNKVEFEKQYESGELKRIGRYVFDGTAVMLYEWKFNAVYGAQSSFKKTIRTWIGIDDNLPRKEEEATEAREWGLNQPLTTRHTLTIHDYNTDIRIEPPM